MTDKDTLLNIIGASHDLHMQKIDAREDTLISRAREWTELCVNNLQKYAKKKKIIKNVATITLIAETR